MHVSRHASVPSDRLDAIYAACTEYRLRLGGPVRVDDHEREVVLLTGEGLMGGSQIGDRVVVLPFLERHLLAAVYRRARCVVLPSDREGFGFPVVEALASGAPIVASDLPVLREAGGEHALYARPGDADDFAAKLLALLDRNGRPRPLIRFSWDDSAQRIAALYLELANRSGI